MIISYASGGISADWWTGSLPYTIAVDNISVKTLPAYGSSGVLSSSAFDGGDGVQWQTISWDAAAGGSTNVCVRTRTADAADQLASATWSDCYSTSGSDITSVDSRWIQYQLELTTSDPSASPVLNEIRIGYLAPATTTIPDTTTILPTTSTSTSSIIPTTSIPTTTTTVPVTTILPTTTTTVGQTWTQTDWAGGAGQSLWADATRYDSATGIDTSVVGQISLESTSSELFSDDFSDGDLAPWEIAMGTWTITGGGVLQGSGPTADQYSYAYYPSTKPDWTDYKVQGSIQIPAGSFGGGIGGRVDPATGAHYGAWVYPQGSTSPNGAMVLILWKFQFWNILGTEIMLQKVSLPDDGTGWHTLQLNFIGNRILVYYDGSQKIDVTDDSYSSGGISADWWTGSPPHTISVDNISVTTLPSYGNSGVLFSSAFDGGDGVQWQTISWDAVAGGSTNVCVRTRTADSDDQLASASWSACYSTSGSGITSANSRWIQYQLELTTSDPSASPVLNEIRIGYLAPATTTTTKIEPTTTTSTVEPTTTIPAPNCVGVAPASADQGATLDVTITGVDTSFVNGVTSASFSCTGITVNSTLVTSPAQAVANITIAADAPVGACDVTVTTGTEIVTCTAAFTITAAPVTTTTSTVELTTTTTTVEPTTTTSSVELTTTTSTVEPTTTIPVPNCAGVAPASADQGATLDVTISGADTSFVEWRYQCVFHLYRYYGQQHSGYFSSPGCCKYNHCRRCASGSMRCDGNHGH